MGGEGWGVGFLCSSSPEKPDDDVTELLAKSGHNAPSLTQHSEDVVAAFDALFGGMDEPSYLGKQWLRFFRLDIAAFPRFYANGVTACALHDLGKANDSFQDALKNSSRQFIRHEHLSAFLLDSGDFSRWLKSGNADTDVVISAVLGHHLKAAWGHPATGSYRGLYNPVIEGESMRVLADHADYAAVLKLAVRKAGLSASLPYGVTEAGRWDEEQVWACAKSLQRRAKKMKKREALADLWQMTRAVKAALIVADSVGSATLVREDGKIADWIAERFPRDDENEKVLTPRAIAEKIIIPRIEEIKQSNPDAVVPDEFQQAAENLGERTSRSLMLAPCGAGKTLAAWMWIRGTLRNAKASRVLFLYPTRGTAVEGFRDYVSHAPESDASLLHGTAKYDLRHELRGIRQNPDDSAKNYEADDRMAKLGYWNKRVFSATVHQFLAFMQQDYGSICLLPLLADSVVVVDEVHSFDSKMFSALVSFLREFDLPVLCMTASLTRHRREALEGVGLEIYPQDEQKFAALTRSAEMPRYRTELIAPQAIDETYRIAGESLEDGKRVLWVVNQVRRCQDISRELSGKFPELICYHSRFRHKDRAKRHGKAVAAFKRGENTLSESALAITTQVCEMSLDLDADVLISELAPIPSLIQRMGRCNRRAQDKENGGCFGRVVICEPADANPYREDDLKVAWEFVKKLADMDEVSQSHLENLLEEFSQLIPTDGAGWEAFIENRFWSEGGGSFMDEDGWNVSAVLTGDLSDYKVLREVHEPADGLILPCPRFLAQSANQDTAREYKLSRYIRLAPSAHYSPRWGLLNEPIGREVEII